MEFGSFFFPPLRAGCNKQTFLSPFHPSVVCSSASALLALSLLTAIPIRKPEPGGKWRDCIDTTDHWAPDNWQLFLSFTSGDGLNRLRKIWWLPKKERRVGEETEASYCLAPSLPGTKRSVEQCSQHRKKKWKICGSEQIRWFEGMFVQKSERLNVLRPLLSTGGCYRLQSHHRALHPGCAVAGGQAEPCTGCWGRCSAWTRGSQCQEWWLTPERGWWWCRELLTDAVPPCSAAPRLTGYGAQS